MTENIFEKCVRNGVRFNIKGDIDLTTLWQSYGNERSLNLLNDYADRLDEVVNKNRRSRSKRLTAVKPVEDYQLEMIEFLIKDIETTRDAKAAKAAELSQKAKQQSLAEQLLEQRALDKLKDLSDEELQKFL